MSRDQYEVDCPGCRPCVLNPATHEVLADDHPLMVAILELWAVQDLATRKAWHAFTCQNSRQPQILALVKPFIEQMQAAAKKVPPPP